MRQVKYAVFVLIKKKNNKVYVVLFYLLTHANFFWNLLLYIELILNHTLNKILNKYRLHTNIYVIDKCYFFYLMKMIFAFAILKRWLLAQKNNIKGRTIFQSS